MTPETEAAFQGEVIVSEGAFKVHEGGKSIKVGDRVLVTKPENTLEGPAWVGDMDEFDGEVMAVQSIHGEDGFPVAELEEGDGWGFDTRWLTKVEGDLKAGRRGEKAPLHEIPLWALHGVARVFDYGGRKYAPGNWIKAAQEEDVQAALEDYVSAELRHWSDIQEAGGSFLGPDGESGLPHLDHMICSLIMLRGIAIKAGVLDKDPGKGN